jgi:enediyne biosynthesis protein E4
LMLCSFVQFSLANNVVCGDNKLGKRFYCIPRVFKPTPSLLYHNNGDGTFTEVSAGTDIQRALGKALGVVATDINGDGLMDLFVANDTVQNFLFVNRGKGKWDEIGLVSEVGFSINGRPRSGMGVDAADVNGDGRQDLFVANVDQEMFSLYQNDGNEFFSDVAASHGVAQATRLLSGWGLKFFDYDNDGFVDLFLANGHPDDMIESYSRQVRYKEPLLLFRHDGTKLANVSAQGGPVFQKMFPARGLAVGDFNNDGRIDVLVGNNGEAPVLLKNNAGDGNHWVGVKLQGTSCNRDAVGATISWSANGTKRSRYKTSGGSYLSAHDMREVLGLGAATKLEWIEIKWPPPSGRVERIADVPIDRYVTIVEGKGRIEG